MRVPETTPTSWGPVAKAFLVVSQFPVHPFDPGARGWTESVQGQSGDSVVKASCSLSLLWLRTTRPLNLLRCECSVPSRGGLSADDRGTPNTTPRAGSRRHCSRVGPNGTQDPGLYTRPNCSGPLISPHDRGVPLEPGRWIRTGEGGREGRVVPGG